MYLGGLAVDTLPLWPVDETTGRCTCNEEACSRPGKHPSPEAPGPGFAVLTGAEHGIFVVDIDVKGGKKGLEQFENVFSVPADSLDTFTVRTGSGGLHLYFRHPGRHVGNRSIGGCIDIRGDGKLVYVVGPGSKGYVKTEDPCVVQRASDYVVAKDVPIAPAPDWLLLILDVQDLTHGQPCLEIVPLDESHPDFDRNVERGRAACESNPPAVSGENGHAALLYMVRELVHVWELPDDVCLNLLENVYNPRCSPAWSTKDLEHKVREARTRCHTRMTLEGKPLKAEVVEKVKSLLPSAKEETQRQAREQAIARGEKQGYDFAYSACAIPEKGGRKLSSSELAYALAGHSHPRWSGVFSYDEIRGSVRAFDPPIRLDAEESTFSEEDSVRIVYWFATQGCAVSQKHVSCVVPAIAKLKTFNPFVEYLNSLPPSEGAIEELYDVMGLTDDREKMYVRKFLLASVRRVIRPGCKHDTMLVLQGLPGAGKSTFVKKLFGEAWTSQSLTSLENTKVVGETISGKWGVELAELAAMFNGRHRDATCAFITRTVDNYRPAYGRSAKDFPRICSLVGTVNATELFSDYHDADVRRMWVVQIKKKIDFVKIGQLRDRVWSEAYAATKGDVWDGAELVEGERHYLTSEEEESSHAEYVKDFRVEDEWTDQVAKYLRGKEWVTCGDVLEKAIFIDLKDIDKSKANRMGKVLRNLGCVKDRVTVNGTRKKVFKLPLKDD